MEGGKQQTWVGILIGGLAVAVIGLGAALAIVVSGDDSEETKTVTRNVTIKSGAGGASTTATTTPTVRPEPTRVSLANFKSPTGNIGCAITSDSARCDIRKRNWSLPPKPSNCELDWGQAFAVGDSGEADFVCAGDTTLDPSAPKLAYGEDSLVGDFNCASRESGITCTNTSTEHGFLLNQERYKLF